MILVNILLIIFLLALAICFHELGHWLWYYRNKGQKFNIQFFYNNITSFGFRSLWNVETTPDEEMNSLLMGIGAGLMVIILVMVFSHQRFFVYTLPIYTIGCNFDIRRLIDIIKEKNIDFKIDLKQEK